MDTLWDRWCLVEFTSSIWSALDNVLQYHVWNTRNPFLHPDLIVWILWKPHLTIHRKCLCNEASTISFHKHQFYKHQPLHLKCLLHPCVWYIWWYSVGKKVWCKLLYQSSMVLRLERRNIATLKTSSRDHEECVQGVLKTLWRQTKYLMGISVSNKSKCVSKKSIYLRFLRQIQN